MSGKILLFSDPLHEQKTFWINSIFTNKFEANKQVEQKQIQK